MNITVRTNLKKVEIIHKETAYTVGTFQKAEDNKYKA